ncbi:hypothetical protein NHQ30_009632 [Ciborinia camelliae]|nr:hypothetical protein NHQ30_009632 [Ciborinia camelliae]
MRNSQTIAQGSAAIYTIPHIPAKNLRSIAEGHETPEFQGICEFMDHHRDEPIDKDRAHISSYSEELEHKFISYDRNTIEIALATWALVDEEANGDGDGAGFLILYSLLARIQHRSLGKQDAWQMFKRAGYEIRLNPFEALVEQAKAFKARDVLETRLALTDLLQRPAIST